MRGYESGGRYALALTKRLAVRRARQRGAEAVLLLEDDCVLHPNLLGLLEMMELPEDWGILYLGCAHHLEPEPAAPGLVRIKKHGVVDNHAVAIHSRYYDQVLRAMDAHGKPDPGHPRASDRYLAALADEIPSYACFPNLAWQAVEDSDLAGMKYSSYEKGGTQKQLHDLIERTWERMYGRGDRYVRKEGDSKLALMFLTRGDVNLPRVWEGYVAAAPERVRVFSHPKDPQAVESGFLDGSVIDEHFETEWGSISLVQATLAMLREALEDESMTHFVLLSESCVPVRPLPEILRELDWNPKPRFKSRTLSETGQRQVSRATALPEVPNDCWRFQSQWWLLDRIAANWVARADYTEVFERMEIPDEAYFSTVLCLLGYPVDDWSTNNPVTWSHWEKDAGRPTEYEKITMEMMEKILESGSWFARKFPVGADIGKYGLHLPARAP
ncbi:beta-1,6-N-acetylglucosaminyltransferase [Haloferula chungangensis]|uniref:beta-1,6-N-acetylglucosaminyltransferase n=1 Tax=Haloferula chungangensis TaxID=1048331 RepID=UPI0036D29620